MFSYMLCLFSVVFPLVAVPASALGAETHATSLKTKAEFAAFSVPAGEIISGGRIVKFLIDADRARPKRIYFFNGNFKDRSGRVPTYVQYHFDFATEVLRASEILEARDPLKEFNDWTYFKSPKRYYAGKVQTYALGPDAEPLYGVQFFPQDAIREGEVLIALRMVKAALFPGEPARMGFVAMGAQQTTDRVADDIKKLGFENLTVELILGSKKYIPMHLGKTMGFLKIFPKADDLSSQDIPVFNELPLDLSVVAGVITKDLQDALSHINLKSKERNTPNMVLRDADPEHPLLKKFAGRPVQLTVSADGFEITDKINGKPITAKMVQDYWKARSNRPWTPNPFDPNEKRLLSYDEMCVNDASACLKMRGSFGNKAANLGFLGHPEVLGRAEDRNSKSGQLRYDLTPRGIGVPLAFYDEFVKNNPALDRKIAALIKEERKGSLSGAQRAALIKDIQEAFYAATFPNGRINQITARMREVVPGVKKFKIRSSANAEDVPNFDGAGLYDSFSANLEETDPSPCKLVFEEGNGNTVKEAEMKPKRLECALKGVYASLWNKRAVEERTFARVEHESSRMGIAVVPKYNTEGEIAANFVVVTRVVNVRDMYGYTLSVQKGNNVVTNPDPGTQSETTIAGFLTPDEPMTFSTLRFAKPVAKEPALKERVIRDEGVLKTLVEIAQTVERAYCRNKRGENAYYRGDCDNVVWDKDKPKALDFEFKLLENGHFICKQVREFSGK